MENISTGSAAQIYEANVRLPEAESGVSTILAGSRTEFLGRAREEKRSSGINQSDGGVQSGGKDGH